jgi:hypothetical protein
MGERVFNFLLLINYIILKYNISQPNQNILIYF